MKIIKKLSILILISLFMVNISSTNFISNAAKLSDDVDGFQADITANAVSKTASLKTVVNRLLGFLRIISALVLVLVLGTTGYKYIVATPEIKGELKKRMLPVIIGIILVFSAASIAAFILGAIGG